MSGKSRKEYGHAIEIDVKVIHLDGSHSSKQVHPVSWMAHKTVLISQNFVSSPSKSSVKKIFTDHSSII